MALDKAQDIKKHFDTLKTDRSTWEQLWQEVSDYGLGRRTFTEPREPQGHGKRTVDIYDNTMMVANELLASGLHNLLTPTAVRGFHLELEQDLLGDTESMRWASEAEDIMHIELERPEAGFHAQMSEVYNDIAAFGNGAISCIRIPGEGPIFQSMPLSETYIEEGPDGRIVRIYRLYTLTAAQMKERFQDDAPDRVDASLRGQDLRKDFQVLQALIPNPIFSTRSRIGPSSMEVTAVTMDYEKGEEIERRHFNEMPIVFGRLNKDSDELYARGPGIQALSDARMLNEMNKTTLQGAQKAVNPPMLVPDNGFITQVDMGPGGLSVYRAATSDQIRELYTRSGQNVDLGAEMIRLRQGNVKAAYHYELLSLIQDPRMTATQVIEISSRVQQVLSPLIGRLQVGLLDPLYNRHFNILLRMGKFPPPPGALRGREVKIRFVSPVQRAQRANEARATLEAMNNVMQLGQMAPGAIDRIHPDRLAEFFFNAYGAPPEVLRSNEELAELRAGRAALQEERDQREQIGEIANAASSAAPALQMLQGGQEG